jgi:hypothetical protein
LQQDACTQLACCGLPRQAQVTKSGGGSGGAAARGCPHLQLLRHVGHLLQRLLQLGCAGVCCAGGSLTSFQRLQAACWLAAAVPAGARGRLAPPCHIRVAAAARLLHGRRRRRRRHRA